MNGRAKVAAPDAAIDAMEEAIEVAVIGLSWNTDRIAPMIDALGALAAFSSESPHESNKRLELIRKVATEAKVLMTDEENYFRTELRLLKEKLVKLEGGAQ